MCSVFVGGALKFSMVGVVLVEGGGDSLLVSVDNIMSGDGRDWNRRRFGWKA